MKIRKPETRPVALLVLALILFLYRGVSLAFELVELEISAIDSVSGKAVPGVRVEIHARQASGEWPLKADGYTDAQGAINLEALGDGFLIQAYKDGYEWFSYGGCSGYLLAKVIWLDEIRTTKVRKAVQLTEDREVIIDQAFKYIKARVYITPIPAKLLSVKGKDKTVSR